MHIQFCIHHTFTITGRGVVFVGEIIEGKIHLPASYIEFEFKGQFLKRKVKWIDAAMRDSDSKVPHVGVILEEIGEDEQLDLKNWEPKLTMAKIYSTKPE